MDANKFFNGLNLGRKGLVIQEIINLLNSLAKSVCTEIIDKFNGLRVDKRYLPKSKHSSTVKKLINAKWITYLIIY